MAMDMGSIVECRIGTAAISTMARFEEERGGGHGGHPISVDALFALRLTAGRGEETRWILRRAKSFNSVLGELVLHSS